VPERYVLALAALDPRKNGPFLIRAFARAEPRLRAAGRTAELWMVGAERPEAYPLPLQPAPPWLALRGFAPRATLVRLMQGAAAFVFPSLYEGFGLPVLEAMACGVPVLASDRTSVPEVAGDAGLLFDPTDEEALAGALVRVLCDDALRQRLATRGPARAAGFTWAETARRTYAVFREALGLPASASSAAEAGSAPA
jgi:glycosyltransferase involved in cell wall biosynthesis